jgi:glycosyltransferase involved in cell wall biosynthesis
MNHLFGYGRGLLLHKIVIVLNSSWNIINFRSGLIKALITKGFDVIAVAPEDKYAHLIKEMGCKFVPISMKAQGKNVFLDIFLLLKYIKIFYRESPDALLAFTIKPNIYASFAARILRIPRINNISGLGVVFINPGFLTMVVKFLYKLAFKNANVVFFQNKDDFNYFIKLKITQAEQSRLIPGSGINLKNFKYAKLIKPKNTGELSFLLIARLLWDKGIAEYVNAAKIVKSEFPNAKFFLLGPLDENNPSGISMNHIIQWEKDGHIQYLGTSDKVSEIVLLSDCVVLPSYREGIPKSLLEGAAMGRPLIATNVAGCREVIDDGLNGLICMPKNAQDLADKMMMLIKLSHEERQFMGNEARKKVEIEFDEKIVIDHYLSAIYDSVD